MFKSIENTFFFKLIFQSLSYKVEGYHRNEKLLPQLYKEIDTHKADYKKLKAKYDSLEKAVIELPNVSIKRTHKNYTVIISCRHFIIGTNPSIEIRIWHIDKFIATSQNLSLFANLNEHTLTVKLEDISTSDYNKGLGQTALLQLIEIAKGKGYKKIKGKLAYCDLEDHKERLLHFYNKLGFKIQLNKIEKGVEEGEITLVL